MSTKAKTQANPVVTPTPMVQSKWGVTPAQGLLSPSSTLFSTQNDTETTDTDDSIQRHVVAAAADDPPPPNVQLQQAKQFGYTFGQLAIAAPPNTLQRHNKKSSSRAAELKSKPEPKTIQRDGRGSFQASSSIENKISQSKGGGQPLSDNTRNFMESRFNNDFSKVRVHTNADAVQMNRDLSAQAFTHGNDLYFNSGKYNPESSGGKKLLAHELTHTIQQTGPSTLQPKAEVQPAIQKKVQKKKQKGQKKTPNISKKSAHPGGESSSLTTAVQNKPGSQNTARVQRIQKRSSTTASASSSKPSKIRPKPKVQRRPIIRKPLVHSIQRNEEWNKEDGTVNLKPIVSSPISAQQTTATPLAQSIQRHEQWNKEDGTVNLKPLKVRSTPPHIQRKETWDGGTVYLKPIPGHRPTPSPFQEGNGPTPSPSQEGDVPTPSPSQEGDGSLQHPWVQTKLTVGAPGDKYEREADQMADRVMSMSFPAVQQTPDIQESPDLQADSDIAESSTILDLPDIQEMPQETPDLQRDVEDREFELGAEPEVAPAEESVQRFLSVDSALLQRDDDEESGDKESMKGETQDAKKSITAELNQFAPEPEDPNNEPQQAGNKATNLVDKAESDIANAGSKKKAKKNAKQVKKDADQQKQDAEDQERREREKEEKKKAQDILDRLKQQEEQKKKDEQDTEVVLDDTNGEGEGEGEGEAGASTDSGESDPPPPAPNPAGEGLPDPGLVTVPGALTSGKTPKDPNSDPRFQAVETQVGHLASTNTEHDPADEKAKEAQDASVDEAQSMRRGQSSQMNEAGDTQPGIFDREAFVSGLLAILESNKPKSREDVEKGRGMDGASEGMKAEIDKTQDDAGGELETNALSAPVENPSDAKTPGEIIDAATAAGEKASTDQIDAEGAIPQKLTADELDTPIEETRKNFQDLIPKDAPGISLKLEVGAPGDKYEQEADRMADQVMSMPDVSTPSSEAPASPVQRSDDPLSASPEGESAPDISTFAKGGRSEPVGVRGDDSASDSTTEPPIQRMSSPQWGPEIQLAPGVLIQRKEDGLTAETPNQDELPFQIDETMLDSLEGEGAPVQDFKSKQKKADQHLGDATKNFRADEDSVRTTAISEQKGAIASVNEAMFAQKTMAAQNVEANQTETKSADELKRMEVTQHIQGIYDRTQGNVDGILARMHSRVDAEFARTDRLAKATFERRQKQLFKQWKDDYYGVRHPFLLPWVEIKAGAFYFRIKFYLKKLYNWPLWAVHKVLTGLPDEVNQIYEVAKEDYLNVQREGVHRIADIVEEELTAAKAEVDNGRAAVQSYVDQLPEDLKEVGQNAADAVMLEFMQLELNVKDQQNSLMDELKGKYEASLSEINDRIEALKAANKGFIGQALDALADLAKWILRQILRVLEPPLKLIPGIGSHVGPFLDAFVDDPGGIMKTLFGGIAKGFELFGQNVLKHLPKILFTWLLGSGINIIFPKQFNLQGILDILLQILGVSGNAIIGMAEMFLPGWASELISMIMEKGAAAFTEFRETLVELGVPQLILKFFEALVLFPSKGIMAIWDFLKDMVGSLKESFIMTLITQLIIPEVVVAGIQWLIGLLNPAAGIVKIAKAIVDVITFFIQNMDMIRMVLEAIGSTMQAVISKNIGTVARAVEYAIVTILPLVLGLFVALLGLGGIPQKIQKVTEKLRAPVDKTIGKVFDKFGKVLAPFAAVGGGMGLAGLRSGRGRSGATSGKSSSTSKSTATAGSASTKNTSTPPNNNSQSSKQSVKDANSGKTKTQDKNAQNTNNKKKESDKERKKREQQESLAATRKTLTKAYDDVEDEAKKLRDPDKVKGKLTAIKSKNKLKSLKLKKYGKKKYYVEAQVNPVSSGGSKTARRHATSSSAAVPTIQASTEAEIEAAQGQGQSLPTAVQAQMEQTIGADFSGVKIHADAQGDRLSRSLEADAFTVQRDVFFKQGAYNPHTSGGQRLLAHELTHVSQNNRDEGQVQRKVVQRKKSSNPWADKNNQIRVKKKKLKATKKGGSFTLSSSLMSNDDVLPDVARKLKTYIKKVRKHTIVTPYLATLKRQYDLKSIKVTGIKLGGRKYNVEAEQESQNAQKSAALGSSTPVAPTIEGTIQRAREPGHGQPMSDAVRAPMENAFGYDFSSVRIHADAEGDRISRSLNANALTTGQDIFFRQGQYNPIQRKGQHLLAHELTHVVQQSSDTPTAQASYLPTPSAFREGEQAVQPPTSNLQPLILQRQGDQPPPAAMGQISPVLSQLPLVQREGDGTTPTSTEGETDATIPDVSAEETSGAMPDMSAMDGSTMAMAGTAMNVVGTGMAVAGAVNTAKNVADAVRGTGEAHMIKRIKGNKLIMYVVLANIPKPKKSFNFNMTRGDWGGEEEGLPANVINDIVAIIQAIVNQDPDDDVVAKKLHFVRSKFELSMVKLMGAAQIGDSFEYLIRVQGKAKALKPGKIASFLKSLAKGNRRSTDAIAPAATETASSTSRSRSSSMATDSRSEGSPPTNTSRPLDGGATPRPSNTNSQPSTTSNAIPTSTDTPGEGMSTDAMSNEGMKTTPNPQPSAPVMDEEDGSNQQEGQKGTTKAQPPQFNVGTTIERIDPLTVDIIVRANPQK